MNIIVLHQQNMPPHPWMGFTHGSRATENDKIVGINDLVLDVV